MAVKNTTKDECWRNYFVTIFRSETCFTLPRLGSISNEV